ncbi:NADH-quinone oxidoreductase subunit M [bacterium]|nr:MAG: NADH-quinone oxidoreductase subunit M [bacterium]
MAERSRSRLRPDAALRRRGDHRILRGSEVEVPYSLFWVVLLPIVLGFAAYALPKGGNGIARGFGVVVSLLELLLVAVQYGSVGRQESLPWFSSPWSAAFHFGSSQISLLFCALLAVITLAAVIATQVPRARDFVAQMLLLEGTMMGLFLARDLLVFALFWDAMLVPVFIMLVNWGEGTAAAWRFLIYNGAAGLGLLLATAAYGILAGSTDVIGAAHAPALAAQAAWWIFVGFAFSYAVKTPLFPFHTWMPDTYTASPAPLAAVISSVQSKSGIYGLLVIGFGLFPQEMHRWAPLLSVLGLIAMLYGAFVAMWHNDAKRVLAYSSLSHLGLLFLGIFSFNQLAIVGVLVYAVAHGLFNAMLFLVVGYIEQREETRVISRLGGLGIHNPKLGGAMMIGSMALLGLPGLAGFAGELLILIGVWGAGQHWYAAIALVPIVLAAAYMLRVLLKVVWGPEVPDLPVRPDLAWWEILAVAPLAAALLLFGLWPNLAVPAARDVSTIAAASMAVNVPAVVSEAAR